MPVEKVDPETGEVLGTFSSIRLAAKDVDACRKEMGRVLRSNEKKKIRGYYWRFATGFSPNAADVGEQLTDSATLAKAADDDGDRDRDDDGVGCTQRQAADKTSNSAHPAKTSKRPREKQVSKVRVGARVAVWWPDDRTVRFVVAAVMRVDRITSDTIATILTFCFFSQLI